MTVRETREIPEPQHRVERVLAGTVLALLPLPQIATFTFHNSTLNIHSGVIGIMPSWIPLALLVGHSVAQVIAGHGPKYPRNVMIRLYVVAAFLLAIPVLVAVSVPSAGAAYLSFILGAVGAVAVGRAWASAPRDRFNAVDLGLVVFLLIGAVQLLRAVTGAVADDTGLHQASQTDWGGSNYAAGVLVVGSLILVARIRGTRVTKLLYLVVAFVVVMSLLTYSRGAIVSLALGAIVLLWNVGRTTFERSAFRFLAIVSPVAFYLVYSNVSSARFQTTAQSLSNIDARFVLYRLGWEQFLQSPALGTGWVSLRPVSQPYLGAPISFAHNLVISFLQIGGLIGFGYLIVLVTLIVMSLRTRSPLSGAIIAAVGISITDPFFEGYIGGLIAVAAIVLCLEQHALAERTKRQTELGETPEMAGSPRRRRPRYPARAPRILAR